MNKTVSQQPVAAVFALVVIGHRGRFCPCHLPGRDRWTARLRHQHQRQHRRLLGPASTGKTSSG